MDFPLTAILNSANITEEDLDYYLDVTGRLPNINPTVTEDYCGIPIQRIRSSFQLTHGCLSLITCVIGVVVNILNIVVLSQKEMRRNNINRILCSLAAADFLLMLEYVPFTCHMYLAPQRSLEEFYSYPWAVFVLFHAHFTLVAHTISIWLTLSLAVWRYTALRAGSPRRGSRCHNEHRCTVTIASAYLGSIVLCIPSFVTFGIEEQEIEDPHDPSAPNLMIYKVDLSPIAKQHDNLVHKAHLWTYSVLMKLGPCLVLTILTCWLVRRLWEAERHRQCIQNKPSSVSITTDGRTISANKRKKGFDSSAVVQENLTPQLEMRYLASAMGQETGVQVIITESSLHADHASPSNEDQASGEHYQCRSNLHELDDTQTEKRATQSIETPAGSPPPSTRRQPTDGASYDQQQGLSVTTAAALSPVEQSQPLEESISSEKRPVSISTLLNSPTANIESSIMEDANTGPNEPLGIARSHIVHIFNSKQSIRRKNQTDRTTRMLVAVLILFLVTEIPQGIMALLSGFMGREFFTHCYNGLGEFLDLFALLNSIINFLLYCAMSRQFRTHFQRLFTINGPLEQEASRRIHAPVPSQTNRQISPTYQSKFTNTTQL